MAPFVRRFWYSLSPLLPALSTLWDGSNYRKSRGTTELGELVGKRVSASFMIQPGLAKSLINDPTLKAQGLLARFLISYPTSTMGTRLFQNIDITVTDEYKAYENAILRIYAAVLPLLEGSDSSLNPPQIPLSISAREIWIKFHDECELANGMGGKYHSQREFVGKIPEHALRIAETLHIFDHITDREISECTITRAVTIARFYLVERFRLVRIAGENNGWTNAKKLIEFIHSSSKKVVSSAFLSQFGPSATRERAVLDAAVEILVDHQYLEPIKQTSGGRATRWKVLRPGS